MHIVRFSDRQIIGFRTEHRGALGPKRLRFIARAFPKMLCEIVGGQNDLAVQDARSASNVFDLQSEIIDDQIF